MACRLFGAKPLSEQMEVFCQLDPWEQTSMKFISEYSEFVQEDVLENVVFKTTVIIFRAQCSDLKQWRDKWMK